MALQSVFLSTVSACKEQFTLHMDMHISVWTSARTRTYLHVSTVTELIENNDSDRNTLTQQISGQF